jgi:hypothetical protein
MNDTAKYQTETKKLTIWILMLFVSTYYIMLYTTNNSKGLYEKYNLQILNNFNNEGFLDGINISLLFVIKIISVW